MPESDGLLFLLRRQHKIESMAHYAAFRFEEFGDHPEFAGRLL